MRPIPGEEFLLILAMAAVAGVAAIRLPTGWGCWPSSRRGDLVVYLAAAAMAVVLAALAIMRHLSLNSHAFDLGVFDQVVWNTSQGRLFADTLEPTTRNLLGSHLTPILLLLAPLYWFHPDPTTLLVVQALALALGALPLYWLAKARLGPGPLAVSLGLGYFLYPALHYVALADFHEIALAVPLLASAAYLLLSGRRAWGLVFLGLALLTREEVGLIVAGFGAYLALGQRQWRLGSGLMVVGVLWTALAITWVTPHFQGQGQFVQWWRYAYLGDSPGAVAQTLLTRPWEVAAHLMTADRAQYLLRLLVPLGLLPLAGGWTILLALPTIAYLLLADYPAHFDITAQYSAPLIPLLWVATIQGVARWRHHPKSAEGRRPEPAEGRRPEPAEGRCQAPLVAVVLVAGVLSYLLHSPLPPSQEFRPAVFAESPRSQEGRRLAASIPPDAAVAAQDTLVPHLSRRRQVYMFGWANLDQVDYILLDSLGGEYPFPDAEGYRRAVARLAADPTFTELETAGDFRLFQRRPFVMSRPLSADFGGQLRLLGFDLSSEQPRPGDTLGLTLYWKAQDSLSQIYLVFVHLRDENGRLWTQGDAPPTGPDFPTVEWPPQQVLRGRHLVRLPPKMPPGEYRLEVGVYRWPDQYRLPAVDDTGPLPQGALLLTKTTVLPAMAR